MKIEAVDFFFLDLTKEHLLPNTNGRLDIPDKPGLGVEPDQSALQKYIVDIEIKVNGRKLYQTPSM